MKDYIYLMRLALERGRGEEGESIILGVGRQRIPSIQCIRFVHIYSASSSTWAHGGKDSPTKMEEERRGCEGEKLGTPLG